MSGTTTPICAGGCDLNTDSSLRAFRAVNNAYLTNMNFNGGSYSIAARLLTVGEARNTPFGQTCRVPNLASPSDDNAFCTDLILVRSTGTLDGGPPGYTGTKTIQVLLRAASGSALGGGITVGSCRRASSQGTRTSRGRSR